jgi:hypothetical protein
MRGFCQKPKDLSSGEPDHNVLTIKYVTQAERTKIDLESGELSSPLYSPAQNL